MCNKELLYQAYVIQEFEEDSFDLLFTSDHEPTEEEVKNLIELEMDVKIDDDYNRLSFSQVKPMKL